MSCKRETVGKFSGATCVYGPVCNVPHVFFFAQAAADDQWLHQLAGTRRIVVHTSAIHLNCVHIDPDIIITFVMKLACQHGPGI